MKGCWVPHDTRDEVVDYVNHWTKRTKLPAKRLLAWLGLGTSKFHDWRNRYGKVNEHNALVPRDEWLEESEKKAILDYHDCHPLEGYRRLCFMMLDRDIVAVSPSSVYRVLISYINLAGTFYYLCSLLDGYSRYLVHWELRESMTERDVETIVQRALEKYPNEKPRIITDNGPQFMARDFKEFIRLTGTTHVRTSPYYPQSNGKLERWHGSLKRERLRTAAPGSLEEGRRTVSKYVEEYNQVRLHSALGYVAPADKLAGREQEIYAKRDRKLEEARARRAAARRAARMVA